MVIGSRTSPTALTVSAVDVSPPRAMPGAATSAIAVATARMAARPNGLLIATPANTTAATPSSRAPRPSRMFWTDWLEASGGCTAAPAGRRGPGVPGSVGGGSSTSIVTPSDATPGAPVYGVPGAAQ